MSKTSRYHSPFPPYSVVEQVPGSTKGKWVTPNLTHAKKYYLRVGVTSTLDVAKDGLADWRQKQALFHAAILPYPGRFDGVDAKGHPDHKINQEDYKEWENEILGRMKTDLDVWADDGSLVDAQLKNYFLGKSYTNPESVLPCVEAVTARMKELGVDRLVPGVRLASDTLWCTGEPDFVGFRGDKMVYCVDLKRKNLSTYKQTASEKSLDENHRLQLGNYLVMLKEQHESENPQLDILMSCRDTNEAKIVPISSSGQWEEAARLHNRSWFLRKDWNPWAGWEHEKERVAAVMAEIEEHNKWRVQ